MMPIICGLLLYQMISMVIVIDVVTASPYRRAETAAAGCVFHLAAARFSEMARQ